MKLTKKLFMSIMTLALVVVTLSASTFAWFTLGNDANIEDLTVNVKAADGMEISEDGLAWKNKVKLSQESGAIEFTALSTYTGNTNLKDKAGIELYGDNGQLVEFDYDLQGDEKNYFYEKVIYIRITNTPGEGNAAATADFDGVALKSVTAQDRDFGGKADGATEADHNANQWKADFSLENTYVNGNYYNFDALNAVKISFATVRENKEVATVLYGYENTNSQGGVAFDGVAQAYATAKDYAIAKALDKAEVEESGTQGEEGYVAPEAAVYGTLPTYLADADLANNGAKVLLKTDFVSAATASAAGGILAGKTLDDNYMYAKVTIRIWLDGWDADCINAILDQTTSFLFTLSAYKEAANNANNG